MQILAPFPTRDPSLGHPELFGRLRLGEASRLAQRGQGVDSPTLDDSWSTSVDAALTLGGRCGANHSTSCGFRR